MIERKIFAAGRFSPEDISVSVNPSDRKIDPAIENQIEALWEAKVKDAKEKNKNCYNGISYRLNSLRCEGSNLAVDFGTIDFKTRECLIDVPGYGDLSGEYYSKGCFSLATVKTSDDKYLLVELSGKSMNPNTVEFLGGIMEADMEMKTGADVFKPLYKELEEEGIIEREDIRDAVLKTIYMGFRTNVGFYFEILLGVPSGDLLKRFTEGSEDADIKSLKAFSRDEYLNVLQNHTRVDKRFIGTIVDI